MSRARRVLRIFLAGFVILGAGVWLASWRIPTGADAGRELQLVGPVPARSPQTLRVATWNIHSAKGRDGVVDLERIARRLDSYDFIGLNEVRGRSGWWGQDQAEKLGRGLNSGWLFHPYERRWGRDDFGNGVVSTCRVVDWLRMPLPHTCSKGHGNLSFHTLDWMGSPIRVIVTHIDHGVDRIVQLRAACHVFNLLAGPVVLMGDLNTTPDDPEMTSLLASPGVIDALSAGGAKPQADRIDWILVRGLLCVGSGTEDHGESDHPFVWADLRLPDPSSESLLPLAIGGRGGRAE